MSEMIDRAARAICLAQYRRQKTAGLLPDWDDASFECFWQDMPAGQRTTYLDEARAAIEALREPTREMVDAADGVCGGYGYGDDCYSADPTKVWQHMIEAALK